MTHGTRACYKRGCRCTPCRAANASYWSTWQKGRQAGQIPLGALIPAADAQRLLRLILRDWLTKAALARELGRHHDLAKLTHQSMIRARTALKVRRLYRLRVQEHPSDSMSA